MFEKKTNKKQYLVNPRDPVLMPNSSEMDISLKLLALHSDAQGAIWCQSRAKTM